jgi:hypothetical protein
LSVYYDLDANAVSSPITTTVGGVVVIKVMRLGHYATSRKVAGSIPDEVIGFLSIHLILPSYLNGKIAAPV